MRTLNLFLFSLTAFELFSNFHCDDCNLVDCDPGTVYLQFLSSSDDSNLFSNGTYNPDSLSLFAIKTNLTTSSHRFWIDTLDNYPTVYFDIDTDASGYIFQFNSTERDTLILDYSISDSKCCGKVPNANFGVYRGDTIFANGYLILKK